MVNPDADEVDPLTLHNEELGSPLNGRQDSLDSIPINSKESRSDVDGNNVGPLMTGKEDVEAEMSSFSDDDEERSLSILSLGE